MNFMDISNWQNGIDLSVMFEKNPLDGVIIKATEATGYTSPSFKQWADWLTENGKLWGAYHFCSGADAIAEAEYFCEKVKPYLGKCVLCADYESPATKMGTKWLKDFLDEVLRLSGAKCLVYCSQSVTQEQDFADIAKAGYKLWVAQYADFSPVYGFLETPWHKGSVAPFDGYVMQQYTSCGVLDGWKSYLDLDKYFGTAEEWRAMYGARPAPEPAPQAERKGPDPVVVSEVLMNRYGVGQERIAKLREAGYDPQKVQAKIDELYGVAFKVKPLVAGNMEYMNSIVKIVKTI